MAHRYSCSLLLWLMTHYAAVAQTAVAQTGRPLFTFGVMTDVQYCDCDDAGTRHYRSSLRKLPEAVQTFNQENVAFVLHLGDFIDHDFRSFDTLNALVRPLKSPLHHVLGNHDFSVEQNQIKRVPATLSLKNRYYSFARDRWRFIVLDGNDRSIYGNEKTGRTYAASVSQLEGLKAVKAPNAQPWNGGLGPEQLQWLNNELEAATKKGEKVLILCHFPLLPEADMHTLWNRQEVQNLIDAHPNVVAYFNGHVHQPNYYTRGKTHFVTFRGMVENEENGFAIVEVYPDALKINGYGQEANRLLK